MADYRHLSLIALRSIRHNDRNSILWAYSRQQGRLSFLLPAGNGREASRRRALLMPLSIVECETDLGSRREILTMRDVVPVAPLQSLHSDPMKISLAMFIAEFLGLILKENQPDEPLFAFLSDSIFALDYLPSSRVANFHIAFLRRLARFIGVEPDFSSWAPGRLFDMVDGTFRLTAPLHRNFIDPGESEVVAILGRINYQNMHLFRFSRAQRNEILDHILRYYSLHHTPCTSLHSLHILRSL